jgi:hypothetical protein
VAVIAALLLLTVLFLQRRRTAFEPFAPPRLTADVDEQAPWLPLAAPWVPLAMVGVPLAAPEEERPAPRVPLAVPEEEPRVPGVSTEYVGRHRAPGDSMEYVGRHRAPARIVDGDEADALAAVFSDTGPQRPGAHRARGRGADSFTEVG